MKHYAIRIPVRAYYQYGVEAASEEEALQKYQNYDKNLHLDPITGVFEMEPFVTGEPLDEKIQVIES